jgi:hypothetical protein
LRSLAGLGLLNGDQHAVAIERETGIAPRNLEPGEVAKWQTRCKIVGITGIDKKERVTFGMKFEGSHQTISGALAEGKAGFFSLFDDPLCDQRFDDATQLRATFHGNLQAAR